MSDVSADAWAVFILGIDRELLESERVGPTRPAGRMVTAVAGEGFGQSGHHRMLARHQIAVAKFKLACPGLIEIPKPRRVKFTDAQIAVAVAVAERMGKAA